MCCSSAANVDGRSSKLLNFRVKRCFLTSLTSGMSLVQSYIKTTKHCKFEIVALPMFSCMCNNSPGVLWLNLKLIATKGFSTDLYSEKYSLSHIKSLKEPNRGKALKITLTECYFTALWQKCELLMDFTYILIADCNISCLS